MRKNFDHNMILYGQMDDGGQSCQKMSEADGQWCKQARQKVWLVGWSISQKQYKLTEIDACLYVIQASMDIQ